jgi:hypothetical protein
MYINDYPGFGEIQIPKILEPPVPDVPVPLPFIPGWARKPVKWGARWVAAGLLLPVAHAHREGKRLAAGFAFANGFAQWLTLLTSERSKIRTSYYSQEYQTQLSKLNWEDVAIRETKRYMELGNEGAADAPSKMAEAGRAAVFQTFLKFINRFGPDAWKRLQQDHRTRYGKDDMARRDRYHAIMREQVKRGKKIGIPIEPVGGGTGR